MLLDLLFLFFHCLEIGDEGLFFHVEGFGFGDVVVLLAG